jgi:lipopolysaccharide biosynthesis glycosyltransferase
MLRLRKLRSALLILGILLALGNIISVDYITNTSIRISTSNDHINVGNFVSSSTSSILSAKHHNDIQHDTPGRRTEGTITTSSAKYAYAFLIGGCNVGGSNAHYRGFLYNVLVATQILREEGSTADFIILIQISSKSAARHLPTHEETWLQSLGIRIIYIPKSPNLETFYDLQMQKFLVFNLTEYRRVLYMDGDVMPITNLDYLFRLSDDGGPLKEVVIVAGNTEPAHGGFFLIAPEQGEYEKIQKIIRLHEEKARYLKGHKFDVELGWGHRIVHPDQWKSRKENGTEWTFHGAFADQGLLYHYAKYVKKNVSILYNQTYGIENYSQAEDGTVSMDILDYSIFPKDRAFRFHDDIACEKFLCDFIHFVGKNKPWLNHPKDVMNGIANAKAKNSLNYIKAQQTWFKTLFQLNTALSMELDFRNWDAGGKPPLGLFPKLSDMDKSVMHGTSSKNNRSVGHERKTKMSKY